MTATAYRIRSYVPRGRRTAAQERAHQALWPRFGLPMDTGFFDLPKVFGQDAPVYLEIGFGSGTSLLEAATEHTDLNFIGVETHQPGIGALLMGMAERELTNIRLFYGDVNDVLLHCIPDASLSGVQIFFPDPWQKRRHHQRRLIQVPFLELVLQKLRVGGELHLATDWEHYALHMMDVVSSMPQLQNMAGHGQFSARSCMRPIVTKFEGRALRDGRVIRDLQLRKK